MNTPPRQMWVFRLGCWAAFVASAVHVSAHVFGAGGISPHAATALAAAPAPYVFSVPGLLRPSFLAMVDGFSLAWPVLLAAMGAAGLAVARHGDGNASLLRSVAGSFALGTGALLVLSVMQFFGLQSFAIAVVAICFGLACVPEH